MSTHYKTLDFFDSLAVIVEDSIYIGESEDELQQELAANTWAISCSPKDADDLAINDFKLFLDEVIDNRRNQIEYSGRHHRMWFCLWRDAQVPQLWFTLISEFHSSLPFADEINVVDSVDSIISEFLEDIYHKAGMWPEYDMSDVQQLNEQTEFVLDVYVTKL